MIQTICDRCKNPITSFDYVELNYLLYHEFYNTGTIVEGKNEELHICPTDRTDVKIVLHGDDKE